MIAKVSLVTPSPLAPYALTLNIESIVFSAYDAVPRRDPVILGAFREPVTCTPALSIAAICTPPGTNTSFALVPTPPIFCAQIAAASSPVAVPLSAYQTNLPKLSPSITAALPPTLVALDLKKPNLAPFALFEYLPIYPNVAAVLNT